MADSVDKGAGRGYYFPMNTEVLALQESIFSTITQMAMTNKAINLAQGFPDFDGPDWLIELARKSLLAGKNQYAPSMGILSLREAIAGNYEKYYGLKYDPQSEIVVTNGATEAIYATITALLNPGDEVIAFEPFYDSYLASVKIARGNLKAVTLKAPDFSLDLTEVKKLISKKTKLLILNNPHNPTGRVFSRKEIEELAQLAAENEFYIMSDEVYEFLTFGVEHTPTASIGELKNRVITISSIGKTLSLTGWKVGWACGPASVVKAIHNAHQFITFCVAHPLQNALAEALPQLDNYLKDFKASYDQRRQILQEGLIRLGFKVIPPQGTYFALAQVPEGFTDFDYCKKLILEKKVATIPLSPFYIQSKEGQSLIRFCFAKKEETLRQALSHLKEAP